MTSPHPLAAWVARTQVEQPRRPSAEPFADLAEDDTDQSRRRARSSSRRRRRATTVSRVRYS